MRKCSKWAEPASKLPSRTRRGEAQTAEQLFKIFGMDIPVSGNPEEEYEFDITRDKMEDMFESKRNEIVDHRELLDLMEQEFVAHSVPPARTEAVSGAQPNPPKEDSEKGKAQENPSAPEPAGNNEVV